MFQWGIPGHIEGVAGGGGHAHIVRGVRRAGRLDGQVLRLGGQDEGVEAVRGLR